MGMKHRMFVSAVTAVLAASIAGGAEAFAMLHAARRTASIGGVLALRSRGDGHAAASSRRALLLRGSGIALVQLAASEPAAAFGNRVPGEELFPQLKGKPYGSNTPMPAGVGEGTRLRGCPSTEEGTARPAPNCFSSTPTPEDADQMYYLEPFAYKGKSPKQAMDELVAAATSYPPGQEGIDAGGWKIMKTTEKYLYMVFESGGVGYYDDLEFLLHDSKGVVGVRSASRTGFLDFGVNAKRINWFATALSEKGWSTVPVTPKDHSDYFVQNGYN